MGLLFTDSRGRIVFADSNFLEMTRREKHSSLVGEPLHRVLLVEQPEAGTLIQEIARSGYVHEHRMDIQDTDGGIIQVACTGVATYDDQGSFIGTDLTLRHITGQPGEEAHFVDHGDILSARIKQIQEEADTHWEQDEGALAQGYFTSQVTALQILLGRMGGPRVRDMVEALINQTASKNRWPLQMKNGHLITGDGEIPLEAYQSLQEQVIDYGVNVIGRRAIAHEMNAVENEMEAHLLEGAGQAGLRDWKNQLG
jgi:hypothetical protein